MTEADASEAERLRAALLQLFDDLAELAIVAWLRDQPTALGVEAPAISEGVRLPLADVSDALGRLTERGLVACTGVPPMSYCYLSQEMEVEARVAYVVREFRSNPVHVMGFMTSNSMERLRTATLRTFADAFRLGRRKPGG